MSSPEALVRRHSRERKNQRGERASHVLLVVRGGRVLAHVEGDDPTVLLTVAPIAAAGYGAEALALVVEGVLPLVESNPTTGRPWQRGEAERCWLTGNGVEEGWVTEVQILAIAVRSGAVTEESWPFRIENATVTWSADPLAVSQGGWGAVLASSLLTPMLDPSQVPDPGTAFVGDPDHGPFHPAHFGRIALDVGVTRMLTHRLLDSDGGACLLVDSTEEADLLASFGLPTWSMTRAGVE